MQTLRRRDQLLVGFTLFSMFFGAGNLIFPPQLGAQAGVDTWPAMAGLAVSAVGLPILGCDRSGAVGKPDTAGGQGPSRLCHGVYHFDLPLHRPLPCYPQDGQHLL